jgi:hypothetical protein
LLRGSNLRLTGGRRRDRDRVDAIDRFGSACRGNAFLVLSHDRRRVLHALSCVTAHPTSAWTARQLTEAVPFETPPRFVLRDRNGIYGARPKSA